MWNLLSSNKRKRSLDFGSNDKIDKSKSVANKQDQADSTPFSNRFEKLTSQLQRSSTPNDQSPSSSFYSSKKSRPTSVFNSSLSSLTTPIKQSPIISSQASPSSNTKFPHKKVTAPLSSVSFNVEPKPERILQPHLIGWRSLL